MKNLFTKFVLSLFVVGMFFAVIPVAFAGVVQDYIHQYYRAFESRYRDPVAGQPNQPAQPYRTNIINALDAVVTCLYSGPEGSKNWQFGGTLETATTAQLIAAMNEDANHPCHSQHVAVYNAEQAGNRDSNGRYAPVVVRDRANIILIWRNGLPGNSPPIGPYDSNQGSPSGRDQAARTKLNAFSDCLMQNGAGGSANWQLSGITDSSTGPQLRDAVRASSGHPCQDEMATSIAHRPGAVVSPSPGATSGSEPLSTDVSGGGAPTSGIAPGTIYTGPGFVNVTPFSTFGRISIDRIINNAINYISGFLAIIAVLSIMYGGILYMTARGDDAQVGKAKQVITLTVVGLVIASFAYLIIIFVTRIFYGG